jgi:hypothetical protein
MSNDGPSIRKVATDLREVLTGLLGLDTTEEIAQNALKEQKDYRTVKFGPEILQRQAMSGLPRKRSLRRPRRKSASSQKRTYAQTL